MSMEKMEIKLKECCLTCEYIDLSGLYGLCAPENREISCRHMPVCRMYNGRKPIEIIHCGQCHRWCPDGTYDLDLDGKKQQYGTCDITKTACKDNHFCSYARRNG